MVVLMADQDSLACSTHAIFLVVLFQSLQACEHRRILLWLVLFGPKGVVAERIEADGRRLVCVKRLGNVRPVCLVLLSDDFSEVRWVGSQLTGKRTAEREL